MSEDNAYYIPFDETIITDPTLKRLFSETKTAITRLEIYDLLKNLCNNQNKKCGDDSRLIISEKVQKQYQHLYKISAAIANKIKGRVTITLPDGHVVIDTCKDIGNTYENYIDDVISENHNTRICIFQTQYYSDGVSYERKFSSTTHQREVYLAIRLGPFRDSAGTIRLSIPDF